MRKLDPMKKHYIESAIIFLLVMSVCYLLIIIYGLRIHDDLITTRALILMTATVILEFPFIFLLYVRT